MMVNKTMEIEVENNKYKLIENYKDAFDKEMFIARYTDYYKEYDYIVGDIAYSKLRLKGFNKKNNNQIDTLHILHIIFRNQHIRINTKISCNTPN